MPVQQRQRVRAGPSTSRRIRPGNSSIAVAKPATHGNTASGRGRRRSEDGSRSSLPSLRGMDSGSSSNTHGSNHCRRSIAAPVRRGAGARARATGGVETGRKGTPVDVGHVAEPAPAARPAQAAARRTGSRRACSRPAARAGRARRRVTTAGGRCRARRGEGGAGAMPAFSPPANPELGMFSAAHRPQSGFQPCLRDARVTGGVPTTSSSRGGCPHLNGGLFAQTPVETPGRPRFPPAAPRRDAVAFRSGALRN